MSATVTAAIIFWILPIFVSRAQGRGKNRDGWAYGLFLGWIGVLILALLPRLDDPGLVECQWCREAMRSDASVCPHCQRDVAAGAELYSVR